MKTLTRIAYISRACLLEGAAAEAQVAAILKRSRWWNGSVGISGALMFNRGLFAQVLEGPRREVETIFEAIRVDPRHADVIKLDYSMPRERAFPHWSMAFVGHDESDQARFGKLADATGFDRRLLLRERLLTLLTELIAEQERLKLQPSRTHDRQPTRLHAF